MKVLHITEIGSIFGGAETYIFFLAKALAERGDENVRQIISAGCKNMAPDYYYDTSLFPMVDPGIRDAG